MYANLSLRPPSPIFEFNKPDMVGLNVIFSLQDICKLYVLFNLEFFSDHLLCRLPIFIRKQIVKTLPIFDRLHFENAQFCKGLGIEDVYPPPKQDNNVSRDRNRRVKNRKSERVLYGNNQQIKEKLLKSLFLSSFDGSEMPLQEGCGLQLKEALDFIHSLSAAVECEFVAENHFSYIQRFLPCKLITTWSLKSNVSQDESSEKETFHNYFIVPARFMEFLDARKTGMSQRPWNVSVTITDPQKFRSYCNLHTVVPSTLAIDTIQLEGSAIWREYNKIRTAPTEKHHSKFGIDVPLVNPISPLLQDILASVEHLSIGTNEEFEPTTDDEDLSIDAPNFILTNIISREKPRLKSIHIHGIARTVIDAVVTVGTFLCGVDDCPVIGMNDRRIEEGFEYSLVPPSKSCSIESLRITAESGNGDYVVQYLLACNSATVCNVVKSVLRHQKTTLKQLALNGLGFTYEEIDTSNELLESSSISHSDLEIVNCDEYRSLLNTTLVDFVQLPQFVSLELGDSPDTECYSLILAFMTTPTSHEQKLVISLHPDSKPTIPDWCEQYPIPTALPHSNVQFKSLILKGTETSKLVQHLFGFPDLSLRFLQFSTVILECEMPSTGVNIASLEVQIDSEVMDVSKLSVFIDENPVLKHITISTGYGDYNSSIFNVINECLLRMVKKRMSLDSITLLKFQLSKYIQNERRLIHQHAAQGLGLEPSAGVQPPAQGLGFKLSAGILPPAQGLGLQPSAGVLPPAQGLGLQPSAGVLPPAEGLGFKLSAGILPPAQGLGLQPSAGVLPPAQGLGLQPSAGVLPPAEGLGFKLSAGVLPPAQGLGLQPSAGVLPPAEGLGFKLSAGKLPPAQGLGLQPSAGVLPPAEGLGFKLSAGKLPPAQGLGLQPSPGLPLGTQPSSFTGSDEEGYDFTKWMPSQEEVDLGTWFASLPDGWDNIPSEVLDKDVFLFLCLVQKLNATLTMTSKYDYKFQPNHLEYNLIPSLEKSFKKSNVKIRKIIVDDDLKKFEESLMRIASTVEIID